MVREIWTGWLGEISACRSAILPGTGDDPCPTGPAGITVRLLKRRQLPPPFAGNRPSPNMPGSSMFIPTRSGCGVRKNRKRSGGSFCQRTSFSKARQASSATRRRKRPQPSNGAGRIAGKPLEKARLFPELDGPCQPRQMAHSDPGVDGPPRRWSDRPAIVMVLASLPDLAIKTPARPRAQPCDSVRQHKLSAICRTNSLQTHSNPPIKGKKP